MELEIPACRLSNDGTVAFCNDEDALVSIPIESTAIMPVLREKRLIADSDMMQRGYEIYTLPSTRQRYLANHETGHTIPLFRRGGLLVMLVKFRENNQANLIIPSPQASSFPCQFSPNGSNYPSNSTSASSNFGNSNSTHNDNGSNGNYSAPSHANHYSNRVPLISSFERAHRTGAFTMTRVGNGIYFVSTPRRGVSIDLFHRRMGHASDHLLRLARTNTLGAPEFATNHRTSFCPSCVHAKQKKSRHRAWMRPPVRSVYPFVNVHTDVMHVSTDSLIDGFQTSVLFVDDFSHYCWRDYMKAHPTGSDITQAFDRYLRQVVIPFGCRVTLVCADRANEYKLGSFLDYLNQNSIAIRLSASNRHKTNGLAERMNLQHSNMARAMLIHAQRPLSFWRFAMDTAVYITNRSPTSGNLHWLTPYECLTGEMPDVSILRVWGCPANALLSDKERNLLKWDLADKSPRRRKIIEDKIDDPLFEYNEPIAFKSRPYIFVGYARRGPGWLLLDPVTYEVIVSIDAAFDEEFARRMDLPRPRETSYEDLFRYDPSLRDVTGGTAYGSGPGQSAVPRRAINEDGLGPVLSGSSKGGSGRNRSKRGPRVSSKIGRQPISARGARSTKRAKVSKNPSEGPRATLFVGVSQIPPPSSQASDSDRDDEEMVEGSRVNGDDIPEPLIPGSEQARSNRIVHFGETNEILELESQVSESFDDYDVSDFESGNGIENRSRKQPKVDKFYHLSASVLLLQRYLSSPLSFYDHFVPSDLVEVLGVYSSETREI